MRTITVDIINNKALQLLQDLEGMHLIRLHKEQTQSAPDANRVAKYKGAMTKQPLAEIDKQLNDLRNGWE